MEIFASAVNNGIEMPNECRRKLELNDAEGGDQLIVNGNYIPLKEVGKQYNISNAQQEPKSGEPEEEPESDEETAQEIVEPEEPEPSEGAEGEDGQDDETAGTESPDEEDTQKGGKKK